MFQFTPSQKVTLLNAGIPAKFIACAQSYQVISEAQKQEQDKSKFDPKMVERIDSREFYFPGH